MNELAFGPKFALPLGPPSARGLRSWGFRFFGGIVVLTAWGFVGVFGLTFTFSLVVAEYEDLGLSGLRNVVRGGNRPDRTSGVTTASHCH